MLGLHLLPSVRAQKPTFFCSFKVLRSAMHADCGVFHILMTFSIDLHLHVLETPMI